MINFIKKCPWVIMLLVWFVLLAWVNKAALLLGVLYTGYRIGYLAAGDMFDYHKSKAE